MKNIRIPVYSTSLVLAFYTMTPYMGIPLALFSTLFLFLNGLFIWMVISVLKDGIPSNKRFEESWYEDLETEVKT